LLAGALLFLLAEAHHSALLGLAAGLLFGLSYLVKEPGVFVAAAFALFALLRRQWRLGLALAAGVALVMAAEMAWYWSQNGDLLFRLHAMAVHNRSEMAVADNQNLSYRLWKAYPRLMLVPGVDYGLHSLLGVGLAAVAWLRWRSAKTVLLSLWAVLPFLYLNFGTSSFRSYWALPVAPRYISLVYVPLFVLAATVLVTWAGDRTRRKVVAGVAVAMVCTVGVACAAITRGTGYRAEHVQHLKAIAAMARRNGNQICEFVGPNGTAWRQVLQIVAPDSIGCAGPAVLEILPGPRGLPMSTQRSPGTR
jgi:4-amino-4-deoxy-L-arabinose transferase-like glycosyltransferase